MHYLWNEYLYRPLYNLLIALTAIVPGADIGLAIILLTILVKLVLYPFTKRSIESQIVQKELEPELARIKKEFPDSKVQAEKTMQLYKDKKASPFSGCLPLLIQFPIIIALYYVFYRGLSTAPGVLYSFIPASGALNTHFLGLVDLAVPNLALAIMAGLSQFLQMHLSLKAMKKIQTTAAAPEAAFAQSMQTQMQFVLPIMIIFIGLRISGAVALYWITSNIVSTIQEYLIRKNYAHRKATN
jgi:YidC/Oxa1 family membrane protein insertase